MLAEICGSMNEEKALDIEDKNLAYTRDCDFLGKRRGTKLAITRTVLWGPGLGRSRQFEAFLSYNEAPFGSFPTGTLPWFG